MYKNNILKLIYYILNALKYLKLKFLIRYHGVRSKKILIVIGSSNVYSGGWIPTDIDQLNIVSTTNWNNLFRIGSIDAMLAEHVLEHLDYNEAVIAAKNCYNYLRPGGYLRIAVPDGNHPSPEYIDAVKPGGTGSGADDHKVLYTITSLISLLQDAGFTVDELEYFDDNKMFIANKWSPDKGMIWRSFRYDKRNVNQTPVFTSIIVDAVKKRPS